MRHAVCHIVLFRVGSAMIGEAASEPHILPLMPSPRASTSCIPLVLSDLHAMPCASTLTHTHTHTHHTHSPPAHAPCCPQGTTIRIEAEELDYSWRETRPGLIDSTADMNFKVKLVAKADLVSAQRIEAYGIDTKGARQQPAWLGIMPPACRASALVLVISWQGEAQPPA